MTPDPAAIFRDRARRHERMFWLDGGGARPWSGRRSILGFLCDDDVSLTYNAARRVVTRHRGERAEDIGVDVFDALDAEMGRDAGDPAVSWVGYFGYGCRADLPARPAEDVPDAVWMRMRDPIVLEHPVVEADGAGRAGRVSGGALPESPSTSYVPAGYAAAFAEVQHELHRGNTYEVNLTYREHVTSPIDPVAAYLALRALNPAPYAGYLQHHGVSLLSSSPERFATVDRGRWLETKPIKGTTPRGVTAELDERLRERLTSDPKFRAENLMIVDLLRSDLARVCVPGTVSVPALMQVESYATVHQLVSTVRGRLSEDVDTVAALRSLFPAGSMTGAPKLRTMEIIDRVEAEPRGVYAGAFGWISANGRADLGVVIRSLVARQDGGDGWRYSLGTGGGITVRSEVETEYAETRWKAERLHLALS
ncbi:hypothetical protein BH18ACT9_BH18ACT9_04880 [soil metagenome]